VFPGRPAAPWTIPTPTTPPITPARHRTTTRIAVAIRVVMGLVALRVRALLSARPRPKVPTGPVGHLGQEAPPLQDESDQQATLPPSLQLRR
jgi:hypothetical protein